MIPRPSAILWLLVFGGAFALGWHTSTRPISPLPSERIESASVAAAVNIGGANGGDAKVRVATIPKGKEIVSPAIADDPQILPADPYQVLRERAPSSVQHDSSPYLDQVGVAEAD